MNHPLNRPGESEMPSNPRPIFLLSDVETADRLSTIWEATRPTPPSADLLDALWASASAELDRVQAQPVKVPTPSDLIVPIQHRRAQRRFVFAVIALGQAAALLLAIGFGLSRQPVKPSPTVTLVLNDVPIPVISKPPLAVSDATKSIVDVGVDQTLLIRITDGSHQVVMLDQAPIGAQFTQHDFFNSMENEGTP